MGHLAWGAGELEKELKTGVWALASCSSDLILRYANGGGDKKKKEEEEEDETDVIQRIIQKNIEKENGNGSNDLWYDILTCMGGHFAQVAKRNRQDGDMNNLRP